MDLHAIVAQLRNELEGVKLSIKNYTECLMAQDANLAEEIELLRLNLNNVAASADIDLLEALPENYVGIVRPTPATEVTATEKAS